MGENKEIANLDDSASLSYWGTYKCYYFLNSDYYSAQ